MAGYINDLPKVLYGIKKVNPFIFWNFFWQQSSKKLLKLPGKQWRGR
jgi:hypothetical protein